MEPIAQLFVPNNGAINALDFECTIMQTESVGEVVFWLYFSGFS